MSTLRLLFTGRTAGGFFRPAEVWRAGGGREAGGVGGGGAVSLRERVARVVRVDMAKEELDLH